MNPALLMLIRMRWRAMFRKTAKGFKTPRGAFFFILGLVLITLWLSPTVVLAFRGDKGNIEQFHAFMPLALLGMCLLSLMTSAGERAIYFTPGEVEFLFPGPFTRREVLAYKLLGTVLNVLLGALIFSTFVMRFTTYWIAAYIGVVLALVFVQYFTMAILIIGETMSQRAYTRIRKAIVSAGAVLFAVAAGNVMAVRGEARTADFVTLLRESPWLKYVVMPLEPYGRVMLATNISELALWGSVCVAINLGLFAFIVLLDAEYRETAIRVSQRLHARMQRAQRTGMGAASMSSVRRGIPPFPWLGGAGPIMWRQTTNAVRNLRSIGMILILLCFAIGIPAMKHSGDPRAALTTMLGMLSWLTIMLSMMIRFDFRADIEQMEFLKLLPIRPISVAAGQLIVPVVLCTLMQIILTSIATYFLGRHDLIALVALFGLPINLLLFAVENTMFLFMPTRTAAFSPGDFQIFGRQLLFIVIKAMVVGIACLIAAGAGIAVSFILSGNKVAAGAVGWTVLMALSLAMLPCVAWAYNRHDVSRDTPA